MSAVQGPTLGRRRLRARLRAARIAAGLTQEQVASAMEWSPSKMIRIEAGTVSISTTDVLALVRLYDVTDERRVDELVALARRSRLRHWWSSLRATLPPSYAAYIGLEAETSSILYFHPTGLPNLFQTESYATAGATRTGEGGQPAVRLGRQREVLGRPDPPQVVAVLDEAVLRRIADGPHDLRDQLHHLLSLSREPHITIHVLPFTTGVNHHHGPFAILQFAEAHAADVMYVESAAAEDVVDRPGVVDAYRGEFERLCGLALSPGETSALLDRMAGEPD
ncbi:helix-turn-helix transcriptional regulator [Micromonospora sp. NPDC049679]|uniref:helix-turn-helix domain-containing protein n=1 Tax=Micromonospora sp. NPDC049679 TaxID=3155920 RepID=UPI00340BED90